MIVPEGLPYNLPVSSLAVPPLAFEKHQMRLNLNDIHLELS